MSVFSALRYPSVFELFCFVFILPNIIAIPVPSKTTLYDVSVQSLLADKCKMPKEIHLPFPKTSDPSTFDYLKVPLKECQMAEAMDQDKESNLLCKEIFEVLKNITCSKYNTPLPEIKSTLLPNDVCSEFKTMEDILPKQNKYLSGRLVDKMICKFLCQGEFETLCQTLLWSYDVQYQIKNAVKTKKTDGTGFFVKTTQSSGDTLKTKVTENNHEKYVETMPNKDTVSDTQKISQEPVLDSANYPNKGGQLITGGQAVNGDVNQPIINVNELDTNHLGLASPSANSYVNPTSYQIETAGASKNLANDGKDSKVINPVQNGNLPVTKVAGSNVQGATDQLNDLQGNGQLELSKNVGSTNVGDNKVTAEKEKPVSNVVSGEDNSGKISKNSPATVIATQENHSKEVLSSILQDSDKNKTNAVNNDNNVETNANPEIPVISNIPAENDLSNVDLHGEENESKVQEKSDSEIPAADNINKLTDAPKEADSVPSKISSDIESSTLQISPDINANAEQDEEQDKKDAEQYNDTENEGDYLKSEYEDAANEISSKTKKPEIKGSVVSEVANSNEFPSNDDVYINRNSMVRGHDEMQGPPYPKQDSGNFFFYFLSIVLILMVGYFIFHNKQKIIALIVEGRHERRRRSHGAGYKKLETK